MAKLILPKSLLDLPANDRDEIVAVLLQASKLPKEKTLPGRIEGDEHNMWTRNGDELLADAEDQLYDELVLEERARFIQLFAFLGLPNPDDIAKSFEPEFHAFEDTLIKAKGSGRTKMSDYLKEFSKKAKQKTEEFMKWTQNGEAFTQDQMKKIEGILSSKLPNYAAKAEAYAVRAGFIGKIRGEAEKKNFETLGSIIDHFPQTIQASEKKGVVLTIREKERQEKKFGRKVEVMHLTSLEAEAVKHASMHAGDKITEISDRHRAAVRQLVMQAKKERWSAAKLAQALFDKFGDHNRDWRRVAITELAFATNDAYLSGCSEGDTLIGMGAVGACKHCEKLIIGKQFTFRSKPPEKDTYSSDMKEVWVGKTNYGRRVAEYVAAVPLHPHCRCRWHRISRFYKMGKDGKLVLKDTVELINEERAKRGLAPDKSLEGLNDEDRLRKMTEAFLNKK